MTDEPNYEAMYNEMVANTENTQVDGGHLIGGEDRAGYTAPKKAEPQSALSKSVGAIKDMAITAADAATGGAGRQLWAEGKSFLHQKPFDYDPEKDAAIREQAYTQADDMFKEARESLPFGFRFGAELGGGGFGVPGLLDKGVDIATKKFAPSVMDMFKRLGLGYGASSGMAALDRYNRDDMELGEAIQMGAFDGLLGVGMGSALSHVARPILQKAKRMMFGNTGEGAMIDALTGKAIGVDAKGPTLAEFDELASQIAKGGETTEGKGLLELLEGTRGEMSRRFHNAIANLTFKDVNPRAVNRPNMTKWGTAAKVQKFNDTHAVLKANAEAANKAAQDELDNVFIDVTTSVPTADARKAAAGEQLGELSSEFKRGPDGNRVPTAGAKPIPNRAFIMNAKERVEDIVGMPLDKLQGKQKKVWNHFTDLFRGQKQESVAQDIAMIPVTGNMTPEQIAKIFPEESTVASFYAARKNMADLLTPEGRINGDPVTREQRRMVTKMIKLIDAEIDETVGSIYGYNKGEFAAVMREQELTELGKKMYQQRRQSVDTAALGKTSPQHYGKTIEDVWNDLDDAGKEAFRTGWKRGLIERTDQRSVLSELQYFYGSVGDGNDLTSTAGRKHMEMILGKPKADALEEVYTRHNTNIVESKEFLDLFGAKTVGDLPAELRGVRMTQGSYIDPKRDHNNSLTAGLAMIKKLAHTKDQKKVDAMMRLLTATDATLAKLIRKGVQNVSPGPGKSRMVQSGIPWSETEQEKASREAQGTAEIEAFLDSLNEVEAQTEAQGTAEIEAQTEAPSR